MEIDQVSLSRAVAFPLKRKVRIADISSSTLASHNLTSLSTSYYIQGCSISSEKKVTVADISSSTLASHVIVIIFTILIILILTRGSNHHLVAVCRK